MAIRLMRSVEVPETPRDRIFRASRLHAILILAVCGYACAAMVVYRWPGPRACFYVSGAIALLLLALNHLFTARFHPANWLVRIGDEGLFIHYRSYLNDTMSPEDPTVAFVPFADIRSACLVHERLLKPSYRGGTETQFLRWIELELSIDPAPLAAALSTESDRPAVWENHWYGRSATLYRDYPVLMQCPPFLRIRWQAAPGPHTFLKAIRDRVQIAPTIKTTESYDDLRSLSRDQQEKRLRQLDERGDRLAAVYLATRLFGLDLSSATTLVEGLRRETQTVSK